MLKYWPLYKLVGKLVFTSSKPTVLLQQICCMSQTGQHEPLHVPDRICNRYLGSYSNVQMSSDS